MNLPDVPFLSMLREKMSWLSTRQSVLSQNLANADVAGYTAHDLKPIDFEQELQSSLAPAAGGVQNVGLTVTDANHIGFDDPSLHSDFETAISGNAVSAEQEMLKVSDTQMQYQAATNLYAKSIQMMRTAIDGNH